MKNINSNAHIRRQWLALMVVAVGMALPHASMWAAVADISTSPMYTAGTLVSKPNLFFILDDSGSMGRDYVPDDLSSSDSCRNNFTINGLYYNPGITYSPPLKADGTLFTNTPTFPNGYVDGFATSPTALTLTSLGKNTYYRPWKSGDPAADVVDNVTCMLSGVSTNFGKFTKITVVTASTAIEKQNFANWYSYYRTRMLMMKSATGRAFKDIGSNYRVGYAPISDTSTTGYGSNFLEIKDFDAIQKKNWYDKLYAANPSAFTPLRLALSKAGYLYANKLGSTPDPMQYSCQRNFTILTTDGYWNSDGPLNKLSGGAIGDQDGDISISPRPQFGGESSTSATISINRNNGSANVASVKVGGVEILSTATGSETSSSNLASAIRDKINACTAAITGSCGVAGYRASSSGSTVTITAPGATTASITTTQTGNWTIAASSFKSNSFSTSDTLADVARYFYLTDLRSPTLSNCAGANPPNSNVCENNVPGGGTDNAVHQHMTTYTVGLGVDGTLKYTEDYLTGGSADYEAIKQGGKSWPQPVESEPSAVDDLWHAAVNGHGQYFSAKTPESMSRSLVKALRSIESRVGAASAAATSSLELVSGDNFIYQPLYRTAKWDGDVLAYGIDENTGSVDLAPTWRAQPLLDAKVSSATDTRKIYVFSDTGTSKLANFLYPELSATQKAYFDGVCTSPSKLSQCATLTATQQGSGTTGASNGINLVNYLRGQRQYEDLAANADRLYRTRDHVLGDMVNSTPVFVQAAPFKYTDAGYSQYKTSQAKAADGTGGRPATLYVSANDGQLHAFNAVDGSERWAYVPSGVMANMHKLADFNYSDNHQFFVDGSPTVGDVCVSPCNAGSHWKTILVGGFRSGGRGFYALDITDPVNPKGLWEFSNTNLGLSFGNPIITKLADGTWAVLVSSGYNNVSPGDGKGHLFVLNAQTGAIIYDIPTSAGDGTTPSGLGKINAWIDTEIDNSAKRVYAGDLLGNVWRFDINDTVGASGRDAQLLASLKVGSAPQPITTKVELAEISQGGTKFAAVFAGTGRFVGESDRLDASQQSLYALKDQLTSTGLGDVRASNTLVQQTLSTVTDAQGVVMRKIANPKSVSWATKNGWFIDFNPESSSPGERLNVDMQFQLTQLVFATNVPNSNACNAGGNSYSYAVDYVTGGPLANDGYVGVSLNTNALTAGIKLVRLLDGKIVTILTDAEGKIRSIKNTGGGYGALKPVRRGFWRELIN